MVELRFRPALLPFPISLTRSGYPRIIPFFHRLKIGKGDDEADRLVRMYLSFFSLYKVITLAKSVNDGLFSSIVEAHPKDVARSIREYAASLGVTFPELLRRYVPYISSSPLHVGIVWEPTWKALPSHGAVKRWMKGSRGGK